MRRLTTIIFPILLIVLCLLALSSLLHSIDQDRKRDAAQQEEQETAPIRADKLEITHYSTSEFSIDLPLPRGVRTADLHISNVADGVSGPTTTYSVTIYRFERDGKTYICKDTEYCADDFVANHGVTEIYTVTVTAEKPPSPFGSEESTCSGAVDRHTVVIDGAKRRIATCFNGDKVHQSVVIHDNGRYFALEALSDKNVGTYAKQFFRSFRAT